MMRWGWFAVALLVTFIVQTAVLPQVTRQVDLLLALALVCGLAAPVADARLAALIVGLAQDMGTGGADSPIGLYALALGSAGWLLPHLREHVNRHVWWVRWLIALAAAVPGQLLARIHLRYFQDCHFSWWEMLGSSLLTALIAALLAAIVVGLPAGYRRRRRQAAMRW